MSYWTELLLGIFESEGTLSTSDVYDYFPLYNKSSLRSAIGRAYRAGYLTRVGRGVYQFTKGILWRKFRVAKRIFDTHDPNPQRSFMNHGKPELDIEITVEGWAPASFTPMQVEEYIDDKLRQQAIYILNDKGFGFASWLTEFHIAGVQATDDTSKKYDPKWDMEIKVVNKQGRHYTFDGYIKMAKKTWTDAIKEAKKK
ncbi:MAG: hypothetical protein MPJ22_00305 [Pirellulales bacterium]|nr:hypothetical protein [Alphaproteobacteria bacterium]MDA8040849.1 hypothetical protein [Pirellulales bacterium]